MNVSLSSLVKSCLILAEVDDLRVKVRGDGIMTSGLCAEDRSLHLVDLLLIFFQNFGKHSTPSASCDFEVTAESEKIKFKVSIADETLSQESFEHCINRASEGLKAARSSNATKLASGEERSGLPKAQMLVDEFWSNHSSDIELSSNPLTKEICFSFHLPSQTIHANSGS